MLHVQTNSDIHELQKSVRLVLKCLFCARLIRSYFSDFAVTIIRNGTSHVRRLRGYLDCLKTLGVFLLAIRSFF